MFLYEKNTKSMKTFNENFFGNYVVNKNNFISSQIWHNTKDTFKETQNIPLCIQKPISQ